MTTVLLLDYGGVLHDPGDPAGLIALAARLGVEDLPARYFAGRLEFDRGQTPADYWETVAGRRLSGAELADANRVDVAHWDTVPDSIVAATRQAREAGLRLALLSNMPHPEADAYETRPWAAPFERLFFSCRIGLVKPDPEIYAYALRELDADPAEVLFLDDRAENVAAAAALSIEARLTPGTAATIATIAALVAARAG